MVIIKNNLMKILFILLVFITSSCNIIENVDKSILYKVKKGESKPGLIINNSILNKNYSFVKELNYKNTLIFFKSIKSKENYGSLPLSCYSPKYVIVTYKKGNVNQILYIDNECQKAISEPSFSGYKYYDIGAGIGLSNLGKKRISSFLKENGVKIHWKKG